MRKASSQLLRCLPIEMGELEGRVELGIRCAAGNGELFQVMKGRANTRDLGC